MKRVANQKNTCMSGVTQHYPKKTEIAILPTQRENSLFLLFQTLSLPQDMKNGAFATNSGKAALRDNADMVPQPAAIKISWDSNAKV